MCQEAYRIDTREEIGSMGDIRRLVGDGSIVWSAPAGARDERQLAEERRIADGLPNNNCLCWVDLPNTLIEAGFKVWRNPDMIPEYYCEALTPADAQSSGL